MNKREKFLYNTIYIHAILLRVLNIMLKAKLDTRFSFL